MVKKYKVRWQIGKRGRAHTSLKKFKTFSEAKKYCRKLEKKNPKIMRCAPWGIYK